MNLIYLYLCGVILFSVIYFLYQEKKQHHQTFCNRIYDQEYLYTKQYVIRNFLTKEECNLIIKEANQYGYKHTWTTDRHNNYPTTDNKIIESWKCYGMLENKIKTQLFPYYEGKYRLKPNILSIIELFIAKYDGNQENTQKSLNPHQDGSEFSFIICLNEDYEGGGTRFVKQNKTIHLNTGDVVVFCGQTEHEGLDVTNGVRYILPGFLRYGYCSQQNDSDDED
jgi:hypothetical protein